ncbi:diacylglycerol kinase [Peptococcaceae bacterium CEB3]|nr:diacylglycerol kinase [Peptococcaceae bacterium CEB3]
MEGESLEVKGLNRKRLCLVYNPYAGRRKLNYQFDTVIRIFQDSGYEVLIHRTGSPQDIEAVAAQCSEVDTLVIAGGDGSIHQAVNGLMKLPPLKRPCLGILPVGTANDLAYSLNLPKKIPEACHVIAKRRILEMDVGMINDRYFVNVASAGLLTDVSPTVDVRVKNALGQLAYYLRGLETLPSFRPFRIKFTHRGQEYEEEVLLMLALNGMSVGGLRKLVPGASLTDGLLDLVIIRQSGWPETLRLFLGLLTGDKTASERLILLQTAEVRLATDRPVCSDLDGEWGPKSPWVIRSGPKIAVLH